MERISPFLASHGKEVLSRQEIIYAWGNRAGKKSDWEKISNGDVVIFYAKYNFILAGRVIYKEHNPGLALAMWPPDKDGKPWEYTFFLNNLVYFKIPISYFNFISGYNFISVQGFQEITEPHISKILESKNNIDNLFKEFSDENSPEMPQGTDSVFINVPKEVRPRAFEGKFKQYIEKVANKDRAKRSGFIDFEEKNKTYARIGSRGEEVVILYEKERLVSLGRKDLAEKIKRISMENTFAGYDILSYEVDGRERKIEVKSTISEKGSGVYFNLSRNEKGIAEAEDNYYIYLVFNVNSEEPDICIFDLRDNESLFSIVPTQFAIKGDFA